jgi:obg-like ATPase 1
LNELLLLTSKPATYLVNISEKDYKRQGNKWYPSSTGVLTSLRLKSIFQWVQERSPESKILPFSISYEEMIFPLEGAERVAFLEEHKSPSQLDKIIKTGFDSLNLINFFTAGKKEVRGKTISLLLFNESSLAAPKRSDRSSSRRSDPH